MPHRTSRLVIALGALVLTTSGCFRFVPTDLETTPPGQSVRVLMTREGAAELSAVTEVNRDAPSVVGTVMGTEGDDLMLNVSVARRQEGFIASSINQTVRVPKGEILTFERRELDGLATGAVIGLSGAITAGIIVFILDPFGTSDVPPGDDPEDLALSFELLSIPFGLGR